MAKDIEDKAAKAVSDAEKQIFYQNQLPPDIQTSTKRKRPII